MNINRRNFAALAVAAVAIAMFPEMREVWHYRGVQVTVLRFHDRVEMHFGVGDKKWGAGYMKGGNHDTKEKTLRRAVRQMVVAQIDREMI